MLGLIKSPWFGQNILKILKDGAEVLALPLCNLINLFIKQSLFPGQCKVVKVKPLLKKKTKSDSKNYRSISLLPVVSKIIEKTIQIQTQEYFDKNGLLYKCQSCFHANFLMDSCLVQLTNFILRGMNKVFHTGMILVDLQKAFCTLDHTVFLLKTECIGFKESVIKWFQSYLSNRAFSVTLENVFSDVGLINCGAPQGSILGLLLFLIYINDLPQALKETASYLYTDNTCIFYQDKDIEKIEKVSKK